MPSIHLSLHYRIIFSTKDRHPFITADWSSRLHEYIGGLIRTSDAFPEAIGGVADHIQLLVGIRATPGFERFAQKDLERETADLCY